jgi:hypothetical protein
MLLNRVEAYGGMVGGVPPVGLHRFVFPSRRNFQRASAGVSPRLMQLCARRSCGVYGVPCCCK